LENRTVARGKEKGKNQKSKLRFLVERGERYGCEMPCDTINSKMRVKKREGKMRHKKAALTVGGRKEEGKERKSGNNQGKKFL